MGTKQECYVLFLNKSWKQLPTKQQLFGHLPPISHNLSKTNKTSGVLLEKFLWTYHYWSTSKARHWKRSWRPTRNDRLYGDKELGNSMLSAQLYDGNAERVKEEQTTWPGISYCLLDSRSGRNYSYNRQ